MKTDGSGDGVRKRAMTTHAPRFIPTFSEVASGFTSGIAKCMKAAGSGKLTSEETIGLQKVGKSTMPLCQTMSVVMSPNGLKAPRAGRNHDIDAGNRDEPRTFGADRHDHGTHEQGCREIVRNGRQQKCR